MECFNRDKKKWEYYENLVNFIIKNIKFKGLIRIKQIENKE